MGGVTTKRIGAITMPILLGLAVVLPPAALAGHTISGGDCWRAGTPLLCRTTWNSTTRIVDLRLYDQFSPYRPGWVDNAETACNKWHDFVAGGSSSDIRCHWTPSGSSSVYLKTSVDNQNGLVDGVIAVTWNCNTSGMCTYQASPMNIWYSEIYFNTTGEMDGLPEAQKTWAFAHELGHTLGLFHHAANTYLMYGTNVSVLGPTTGDYGVLPACSGSSTGYGVRCIYNFTQ